MNRGVRRVREVGILRAEAHFERRMDGAILVRSPRRLGPYPAKLTERLHDWAEATPDRTFLAQRDGAGQWRKLCYGEMLLRVRRIAQGLLKRALSAERPVVILSGNSLEHALLAMAAMYIGVPYAPLAPAYSLASKDHATLKTLFGILQPGLVFADDSEKFGGALEGVRDAVTLQNFGELEASAPGDEVDKAYAGVGPDTIAKFLYTSGSTGRPKGVINTQRMLCSNQEMLRTVMYFLAEQPPVLCDWLPWNHTFGGNHNFGIALYNGGSLYIDGGKPMGKAFDETERNLREIATTAYFNVPKGYEMLVPLLKKDTALRKQFFSRLHILFYAAAGLKQSLWDDLQALAVDACGEEILMVTGLGATESAPFALSTTREGAAAGHVGLPAPGVELKLVPVEEKLEARLRGPNITPGYWKQEQLTQAAFDEEGFYRMGDALLPVDEKDPLKGFLFDGRLAEDFKMASGTWVSVGPLRTKFLTHFIEVASEVVIAAPDRNFVGALVFPKAYATRDELRRLLRELAAQSTGSSTRVERMVLLDEPPSLEALELTDKGTINQRQVLKNRAALVEDLYSSTPSERVICL